MPSSATSVPAGLMVASPSLTKRGTADEEGEIQARGPQICLGYLDSERNASAFTEEGWFCTGDLGRIDARGFVQITGRIKEIIIRKGENISAKEVEDVLYGHPDVSEVAVIGTSCRRCVCCGIRCAGDNEITWVLCLHTGLRGQEYGPGSP